MDHNEAQQLTAERYLLNDVTPQERDEFEAHYFDCTICAQDVRQTAAFLDLARAELKREPPPAVVPRPVKPPKPSWFEFLLRPAIVAPAFGLLLAVIAYQNLFVLPQFGGEIASLKSPHIASSLSLIGANSRDGSIPTAATAANAPMLVSVDIPGDEQYAGYDCVLQDPAGTALWRVPVSATQARDTVMISVPAGSLKAGAYTLVVQGLKAASTATTEVARYRFVLTAN